MHLKSKKKKSGWSVLIWLYWDTIDFILILNKFLFLLLGVFCDDFEFCDEYCIKQQIEHVKDFFVVF